MKTAFASLVLAAALTSVAAQQPQLPADAAPCISLCLSVKLTEANSLVPGTASTDLPGLCRASAFVNAYAQCLVDNCNAANARNGIVLGQQLCANAGVAIPTTALVGAAAPLATGLSSIPISSTAAGAGPVASATSAVGSATSAVASGASSVVSGASSAVSGASSMSSSAMSDASSAVAGASSSVVGSVSSAVGAAQSSLAAVSSSAGAAASSAAGAASSRAASATGGVASAVSSAVAAATSRPASSASAVGVSGGLLGLAMAAVLAL